MIFPKFNNFLVPYWWIHETYHGTFGLDDHYGDSTRGTIGLGGWSLMSGWGGDLSAWEKWLLGFYSDSQINCLAKDSTSISAPTPKVVEAAKRADVKGLKIGVIKELQGDGYQKGVLNRFNESIELLSSLGAEIVEVSCPSFEYALAAYYLIAPSECSSNLARFDAMR